VELVSGDLVEGKVKKLLVIHINQKVILVQTLGGNRTGIKFAVQSVIAGARTCAGG
jgi:hypothetical protein